MLKKKEKQLTTETATFEDLIEFICNCGYSVRFGYTDLNKDFTNIPYIELQKDDICYRSMCGNSFRKPLEYAVIDIIEGKVE